MSRCLKGWKPGDEEACVEPASFDRRRHPVRVERQGIERQTKTLALNDLPEPALVRVHLVAVHPVSLVSRRVRERDELARVPGQQHARFLEQLPRRGNVKRDRSRGRKVGQLTSGLLDTVAPVSIDGLTVTIVDPGRRRGKT